MNFQFSTATQILFGSGTAQEVGEIASEFGDRVLLVSGSVPDRASSVTASLQREGLACSQFCVNSEPTIETIDEALEVARNDRCQVVVALGGGSAIDAGKAVAGILTNGGEILDYLEVVGRGIPLTRPAAPFIAVPTTAGTGAEVTRNAVLGSPAHRVKASLRSPFLLAKVAIIDPVLTYSSPLSVTAGCGLDALSQVIEPFLSLKANPLTDSLCREAIPRATRSLPRLYEFPDDERAREDMCIASLFGGLALANSGLGAVHGIAGPLGGIISAPHGMICGRLLPFVLEANLKRLETREDPKGFRQRFDEVAKLLTNHSKALAEDGLKWLKDLCGLLQVPSLKDLGLTLEDFPTAISMAEKASSMKGNPVRLSPEDLESILRQSW